MDEQRTYSNEEAEAIMRLAAGGEYGESVSQDKLISMAGELGITPEALAAAEQAYRTTEVDKRDRLEYIAYRKTNMRNDVSGYLGFCALMVAINFMSGFHLENGIWSLWCIYPIFGVLFGKIHSFVDYAINRNHIDEEKFQKWKIKRDRKRQAAASLPNDRIAQIASQYEDDKIAAIKEVREELGLGLKEAKDAVDKVWDN